MNGEIHLFILWENARILQDRIIDDVKQNFELLDVIEITWNKNYFAHNLKRFYGVNLPKNSKKEQHCGNGPFLLLIVRDPEPMYRRRRTTSGSKIVNVNLFDSKEMYRKWLGGGHKVHASNDVKESSHDLKLLLGYHTEELASLYANKQKIEKYMEIL